MRDKHDRAKHYANQRRIALFVNNRASVVGRWSEAEVKALTKMRADGMSMADMALALGRTYGSVMKKIRRLTKRGVLVLLEKEWTSRDYELLTDMYISGFAYKDIAKQMGRTIGAVKSRAQFLGITNRNVPWTRDEDMRLTDLYQSRASRKDIAKHMGRTIGAVQNRVRFLGIANRQKLSTPEEREEAIRLRSLGVTCREIAERLGRNEKTVRHWVKQAKVVA